MSAPKSRSYRPAPPLGPPLGPPLDPPLDPPLAAPLTRRAVLVGSVAAGSALAIRSPAQASRRAGPVTLDEFMALSEVLTDDVAQLRDEVGRAYWRSLRADPQHSGPLARLVEVAVRADDPPDTFRALRRTGVLEDPANAATARRILVLWYSGILDGRTVDYLEALAWTTLEFPEPASTEIGFAKWARRP